MLKNAANEPMNHLPGVYAHKDTLSCFLENRCIACLHKLYPKQPPGVIFPPNIRPEMCPRSHSPLFPSGLYDMKLKQNILTVGDGDFSFSLSLLNGLGESAANSAVVATSHEQEESVISIYSNATTNINQIKRKGGKVFHGLDAANMRDSSFLLPYVGEFDIVVWNFPCKSMIAGADAQVEEISENQTLLRQFFRCVQEFLCPVTDTRRPGQVHITHKTFEPFCWWNIVALAEEAGLYFEGSMVFDRYLYPGYVNKKALDDKSFPFHDAQTYVFSNRRIADAVDVGDFLAQNASLVPLNVDLFRGMLMPIVDHLLKPTENEGCRPSKKRRK